MVKKDMDKKPLISNSTTGDLDVCPGKLKPSSSQNNGEFDWDEEVQGYILGGTGYGFIATHIIGAYISEKIGSKYVFGLGVLFTGIFSTLCPIFARWNVSAFIVLRVVIGLASGVVGPAFNALVARWYPLEERQFITSIILASLPLSTVTSMSSSGYLAEAKGWSFVYYLFGGLAAIWFIPWLFLGYDSPEKHPRISEGEKNLIMTSLGHHKGNKVRYSVPWISILTSLPVWAHIIYTFGHLWTSVTLATELPTYLSRVLHFDLKKSGVTSALPFIFSPIGGIIFGYLGQKLRFSDCISPFISIHIFNTICSVLCSAFIFTVTLMGCDATTIVALLCCSMFVHAAFSGGSLTNNLDLGSNFAAILSGLTVTIASLGSILSPLIIGHLTKNKQTLTQWHIVFYIAIGLDLVSYVVFLIFGSVEEQPWNKIEKGTQDHESQAPENVPKKKGNV